MENSCRDFKNSSQVRQQYQTYKFLYNLTNLLWVSSKSGNIAMHQITWQMRHFLKTYFAYSGQLISNIPAEREWFSVITILPSLFFFLFLFVPLIFHLNQVAFLSTEVAPNAILKVTSPELTSSNYLMKYKPCFLNSNRMHLLLDR